MNRYYTWLGTLIPVFKPVKPLPANATLLTFAWHYVREAKGVFLFVLINSVFLALFESYIVIMIGQFIDMLTTTTPQTLLQNHSGLLLFMLFFILILRPLVVFLDESVINQTINPAFTNLVRRQCYLMVASQSMSFFNNDFAGRLANHAVQAGNALRSCMNKLTNDLWFVVIYAASVLAVFMAHSLWLAMPVLLWIAGYALLLKWFIPRADATQEVASKLKSATMGRVVDSFSNITAVKLFANEAHEHKAVDDIIAKQTEAVALGNAVNTTMAILLQFLNAGFLSLTGVLCLYLWQNGEATSGAIAAMLTFATRLAHISGWVMHTIRDLFENIGALKDSLSTLSAENTLKDAENAKVLQVHQGEISFQDVTFHYGKGEGVFEKLSFMLSPRERVGIVGASGAGKTTLINLLLRLHDVENGAIVIDGQNIADVTQVSLRQNIGTVTQEPSLFHRSIFDNIAYGKPSATVEEVEAAAKQAEAHEFIMALPKGYQSEIGERGVKLSGGQRQRIAIARVLLKNAPILILDEATSALDSETEADIQTQLTLLASDKTVIAIAHRLSTIAMMDRLIVLDAGKIVETGSHSELLFRNGVYAKLWARQSGGFLA
jgi:ATP-binding cassette, subfamily B, multidrug efflux pump